MADDGSFTGSRDVRNSIVNMAMEKVQWRRRLQHGDFQGRRPTELEAVMMEDSIVSL